MLKRIASVLLISAVPFAAVACGGTVTAEQPAGTAQSAATKAPVAQNAHGQIKRIGLALGDVALRPDQRTQIEQLAADAEARHAPIATAHKDLALAIAAQVEAGTIDRAALQPKIDAAIGAMDAARTADRAALEKLHGILDADQRAAFVTAMQAQHGEHHEHADKAHGMGGPHAHMKQWAADLKLTEDQKSQIHDAMKARFQAMHAQGGPNMHDAMEKMRDHGAKVLEAFKQDRFVMDEVAPKPDVKDHANKFVEGMLGFVETALPILTPEQRTLAAQKIRDHAQNGDAHF